jgi:hypothetical protein
MQLISKNKKFSEKKIAEPDSADYLINQTDEIDSYVEKKLQKNNIEL